MWVTCFVSDTVLGAADSHRSKRRVPTGARVTAE